MEAQWLGMDILNNDGQKPLHTSEAFYMQRQRRVGLLLGGITVEPFDLYMPDGRCKCGRLVDC